MGRDEASSLPSPLSSTVPGPRRSVQDPHGRVWAVAVALDHREALAGVGQREGQPSAAFRPLIHVRVRSVDDQAIWEVILDLILSALWADSWNIHLSSGTGLLHG